MTSQKYISKLCDEEMDILREYDHFLSVFSRNVDRTNSLDNYRLMDESCMNRLKKIHRVMESLSIRTDTGEKKAILENIGLSLRFLTRSLDRKGSAIHDDIRSLNNNNSRLGLRYNRYSQKAAEPGIIDIRT